MSSSNSNNPAALQGWVKSTDPQSGRVFYANHITRKTQWDPPANWVEAAETTSAAVTASSSNDDDSPLPAGWEVMHDPTTGKPFYVDHERKITTWKRPVAEKSATASSSVSLKPAVASGQSLSNSLFSSHTSSSVVRSYQQEVAYLSRGAPDEDYKDALPVLDFTVETVADVHRPSCPSCESAFSLSKRRHHCRLCGDVFCASCSAHRVTLPLPGAEFEKPVRVCDACQVDVERGNFFSVRRYTTPLQLYKQYAADEADDDKAATPAHVNAALSALTQDVQQWLSSPDGNGWNEKSSVPAETLVPLLPVSDWQTVDRAVTCLAALLAFESLNGSTDFCRAVYAEGKTVMQALLQVLDRSGSDRKTLYVQEQAARSLFYLTDPKTLQAQSESENSPLDTADVLQVPVATRALIDLATSARHVALQRWAAAAVKNLVLEDVRLATHALNEVAATGEFDGTPKYESCLPDLVQTGAVMMVCSLIGTTEDADTRAHAVAVLGAVLESTRAVDAAQAALREMTGQSILSSSAAAAADGPLVQAIVAGGGCGSSVAQLLVSADTSVATMGCTLLQSLVLPTLTQAAGTAALPLHYRVADDASSLGASRQAALEIATGPCLPALVSLVSNSSSNNANLNLAKAAMEVLCAVCVVAGRIGTSWSNGQYEEGLNQTGAPEKVKQALLLLQEEGVLNTCLQVLQSQSSLGSSSGSTETPTARIRECASLALGALVSCSAQAILELQQQPQILSALLTATHNASLTAPSTLRADGALKCLGVLETAASVLMFSWQHSSGAASELLDRLAEVLDAGVVVYLSKVLRTKMDWDSQKAIGMMQTKAAACKLLACLFGIAMNQELGMRRLMEACHADARNYNNSRSSSNRNSEKGSAPSNIVEAALALLQTAAGHARRALVGTASDFEAVSSMQYQTALQDLVDATLLAAGSMSGSSIAPGGDQGTLITADSFLVHRTDPYVDRRKEICNVATDILVRGGRNNGPALLPTMLVGGFGAAASVSSLRLAVSMGQNGSADNHQKLAHSGILVPIADLLKSALSAGDLYQFSAALALVRSCGPHVAAGQGGGLEAVREAIRIATNVLLLPMNPEASAKQVETQESLKSECIAALESLSKNASLWSSISKDALPCIVGYLQQTNSGGGPASFKARRQQTRSAALKAVLQILRVPSHAVSAAESGIVQSLGKMLQTWHVHDSNSHDDDDVEDDVPLLALEVIHVIARNDQARKKARFLESGFLLSIAAAIGMSATDRPKKPSDSRADVTFLGLEILQHVLQDVEGTAPLQQVLDSAGALAFLDALSEPRFVRAMCATLLLKTNMKLARHDGDNDGEETFDVPSIYGPPLILVPETCGGYSDTHEATASLLFKMAVYACGIESQRSQVFWKAVLLQDSSLETDATERFQVTATFAANFLSLLTADYKPFVPTDARKKQDYLTITRPLVRHRLLEILKDSMAELSGESTYGPSADPYVTSLLVSFNVPHICLSLWKDPALLDVAFELIKHIVEQDPDEVLHLFVDGQAAIMSLFDLLNIDANFETSNNVNEIRRFLASILAQLAENGLLAEAVDKYDVRSAAIAALAAACLSEEGRPPSDDEEDDDEDATSSRLSTVLMRCLVELCSVKESDGSKVKIQLSPVEAAAIAQNLGKKICHMVLSRFLERAKLQQYEIDDDENIMDAPDVAMLCAVAQHNDALATLRSIGGLHALSLIAAEGEVSALMALKMACSTDASVLLEGDTYEAMMQLVSSDDDGSERSWKDEDTRHELEASAFQLLARLCSGSRKGRSAVTSSSKCQGCVSRAMDIVSSLVVPLEAPDAPEEDKDENVGADEDSDDEEQPHDDDDDDDEPEVPTEPTKVLKTSLTIRQVNEKESEAVAAACAFLAAIAPTKLGRSMLAETSTSTDALSSLVTSSTSAELQYAALTTLVALAPSVSASGSVTASSLSDVFLGVLKSDRKIVATAFLNSNRIIHTAASGVQIIFDVVDSDQQKALTTAVVKHFMKCVKACVVTRSTTREDERTFSAELAYALTLVLMQARGKTFVNGIFKADVLTSLLHLIQWRCDPKTTAGSTNERSWDATVTNALLVLSSIFSRPDEVNKEAGIDPQQLSKASLMLARPGKAPRRAIDVKSALDRLIETGDASAAVAAQSVADRLF